MIWSIIFIFLGYALLIFFLSVGFNLLPYFKLEERTSITSFSIIVPFRNEAQHLPLLLTSIENLAYPKELFEIIFVDDDSTDNSVQIIEDFKNSFSSINIRIISNQRVSNSPKKDAITTAVQLAKHEWILTTDADCLVPQYWLQTFNNYIEDKHPNMVVAPVNYQVGPSFLHRFQLLDFMSMQGTTIGGFGLNFPFMCNGANLAYRKEQFVAFQGFQGNDHMASGDDVFLFEKFLIHTPREVRFLKSRHAIVTTFPTATWSELIEQRVRWASKTGSFQSVGVKLIGILVTFINLSLVSLGIMALFGVVGWGIPLSFFIIKFLADLLLFLPTIRFFQQEKPFFLSYLFSSIVYPFFSLWIVFRALFTKYTWKGRRFVK